ncbi:hypothetical protein ACWJJH_04215 [Endozoicomonadaceae bacterium StTr2]
MARNNLTRLARKAHRVIAWLVGIQFMAWIVGGVFFALVPFNPIIKSGDFVNKNIAQDLPGNWLQQAIHATEGRGAPEAVTTVNSAQGPLLKISYSDETLWINLTQGTPAKRPDQQQISDYARSIYSGNASVEVQLVEKAESRILGLVDELYGRRNVWLASFDDWVGTRLYFDPETGRYLKARNEFWVFYDALWRLHIMDYWEGENFNNNLLKFFTVLSLIFLFSGLVLTVDDLRRKYKRRGKQTQVRNRKQQAVAS